MTLVLPSFSRPIACILGSFGKFFLADKGKKLFNITEPEQAPEKKAVESDDRIFINNLKEKLGKMTYEEKISAQQDLLSKSIRAPSHFSP